MKRAFIGLVAVVLVVSAIMVVRTVTYSSDQIEVEPVTVEGLDGDAIATHLGKSVQFETVSYQFPGLFNPEAFNKFNTYIGNTYPRAHEALDRETVNEFTLLYKWEGRDPNLKPILLMGHIDVVPISPESEGDWEHPPFSGQIAGGFICSLAAVEHLLAEGFEPKRTIYFSYGHDEELGGPKGAQAVSALLEERGVELECVIDEGGSIVHDMIPGVTKDVALIGVAEKGYISLELALEVETGHSSMPPPETAVSALAEAITKLMNNPFPGGLEGVTKAQFDAIAPEMPFLYRFLFANQWAFGPVIEQQLAASKETNAALRTTIAPTMFEAGVKDNVLPGRAAAVVNFRIHPRDTPDSVIEHVRNVIDDERITITPTDKGGRTPTRVSNIGSDSYNRLAKTIRQLFPDTVVTPFLVLGGTDSRYFYNICDNVYRFVPMRLGPDDTSRLHGTHERIGVENARDIVAYYIQLMRNFDES